MVKTTAVLFSTQIIARQSHISHENDKAHVLLHPLHAMIYIINRSPMFMETVCSFFIRHLRRRA